jgi:hypothetical protein
MHERADKFLLTNFANGKLRRNQLINVQKKQRFPWPTPLHDHAT